MVEAKNFLPEVIRQLKECLQPMGTIPRCIDDRLLKTGSTTTYFDQIGLAGTLVTKEQFNGPQWLGGSLVALVLLVETAPEELKLNMDTLYKYVQQASKSIGLEVGVHMDDHHGDLSWESVVEQIKMAQAGQGKLGKCGFAGLVASPDNPLRLSERASKFFGSLEEKEGIVSAFVSRGARVSVLTGKHGAKEDAHTLAMRYKTSGKTLNQELVATIDPSHEYHIFSHDDSKFGDLIEALAKTVLNDLSVSKRGLWAEALRTNGEILNNKWLNTTCMHLAGMIPAAEK